MSKLRFPQIPWTRVAQASQRAGTNGALGSGERRNRCFRRGLRALVTGAASVAVVASLVAYANAPSGDAIAASVVYDSAKRGSEAIKGRVLRNGRAARGVVIRVVRRTRKGRLIRSTVRVGRKGRFVLRVRPGKYVVTIKSKRATKKLRVRVRRGREVFIDAKIRKRNGGLMIAPVIFNY